MTVVYIPLFRSCTTPRTLTQLHAHLTTSGILHTDPLASTKLIQTYTQMSNLHSAQLVFSTFPTPDSFMWGVLLKCYVSNLFFKQAISIYHQMLFNQTHVSNFVYPSLLRASSALADITMCGKLHGKILKTGFCSDGVVQTALIGMYGALGNLSLARRVFDDMSSRDVVTWSSLILNYVRNGLECDGLDMFCQMVLLGVQVDYVTMLSVTEACSEVGDHKLAKSVHGYTVRRGIENESGSLENSLIVMYSKCGDMDNAERLFNMVSCASTDSCTAMISSYNQHGCFREALDVFVKMQECDVEPNPVTMVSVMSSCSRLHWIIGGRSVHGFIIRRAIDPSFNFVGPALIEMYGNYGKIKDCDRVFNTIEERNIVSWNSLITVYARNIMCEEALIHFVQMRRQGLLPDSFTLASSLPACAKIGSYQLGRQIHGDTIKTGFELNEFVQNSLIDMYSKCRFVDIAHRLFTKVQQRSVFTWNCMISGFVQNGVSVEAIKLLDQMYSNSIEMDKVTFLSAIRACSHLGNLEKGKWFHQKLIVNGIHKDSTVETTLIDMYAKCGDLGMAERIFDNMFKRSVVSWSAMIGGYGIHGYVHSAISLFTRMVGLGLKPNEVTFLNILSACSHAGLVEEGKSYFNLMMNDFRVEPKLEHFICMVDLLSRAGDLDGAFEFIKSMPIPASASIWGALLNGCRIHGRLDMIDCIRKNILELEPDNSGYYVSVSNLYAEAGNWKEFGKLRSMMKDIGLNKVPGYSTVLINRQVYRFGAGDTSHTQTREIYQFLEDLQFLAQEEGYIPERKSNVHSEKLAIAYGIMSTNPGTELRISKNLRVCKDCHNFIKFVSKITNREVIMRDLNRFHHFSSGSCSCGDFW